MPTDRTDSNKRPEDLLSAYAQQRRAQAGPPFALHPATRQLLQGEVTRTYRGGPKVGRNSIPNFWPRVFWGGASVALLLVAAGLWLRYDHEQEVASLQSLTNNLFTFAQDAPVGAAGAPAIPEAVRPFELSVGLRSAPATDAALQVASAPSAPQPVSAHPTRIERRFGATPSTAPALSGPGAELDASSGLKAGLTLSDPRAASAPEALSLARVGLVLKQEPESFGPPAQLAENTPPARSDAGPEVALHFQQVETRYRQNLNSPAPLRVLTSFEFQRNGDAIRIVDADGSIYNGTIQNPANAGVGMGRAGGSFNTANQQAMAQNAMLTQNTIMPMARENAALPPFSFRAAGTNRTLNQVVVFAGEYAPVWAGNVSNQIANFAKSDNAAPAVQSTTQLLQARSTQASAARAKTLEQTAEQIPSNRLLAPGRIEGRASIGTQNDVRIEAQQVGP